MVDKSKASTPKPITPESAQDFTNPKQGDLAIDAREIASFVIDLPPGGMVGLRTQQDGDEDAVKEIHANQAMYGSSAGVTAADLEVLATADAQIALIDKHLGPAEKLVELLTETRAKLDDSRQRKVATIATTVDLRAKDAKDDRLPAAYEKTRAYRSVIAAKAAKTRQRNAAAAAADKAAPADGAPTKPV